jgi:hypothetical protein
MINNKGNLQHSRQNVISGLSPFRKPPGVLFGTRAPGQGQINAPSLDYRHRFFARIGHSRTRLRFASVDLRNHALLCSTGPPYGIPLATLSAFYAGFHAAS